MNLFFNALFFAPVIFITSLVFEYSLLKSFKNPKKKVYGHILIVIVLALLAANDPYNTEQTFLYAFLTLIDKPQQLSLSF